MHKIFDIDFKESMFFLHYFVWVANNDLFDKIYETFPRI